MDVPLTNRPQFAKLSSSKSSSTPFSNTSSSTRAIFANSKSSTGATKTTLSDSARASGVSEAAATPKSQVGGFLKELSQISNRISSLKEQIASGTLVGEQTNAAQTEVSLLGTRYEEITQSKEFKRLLEVSKNIEDNLSGGGSADAIFRALQSERSLLGEDYLDLVSQFAIGNIRQFNSSLNTIGSFSAESLLSTDGAAEELGSAVERAKNSLHTSLKAELPETEELEATTQSIIETPELNETQFQTNEKFALTLRGYSGSDLLHAALMHFDPDANHLAQLTLEIPKKPKNGDGKPKEASYTSTETIANEK